MKQFTTTIALAVFCLANQLSAQIQLPRSHHAFISAGSAIEKVSIKPVIENISFVSTSALQLKPQKIQLNLKKQIEATKALCPLLQAAVSVQLDGDRQNNSTAFLQWKAKNAFYAEQYFLERSIGDTLNFETLKVVWPNEKAATKEKYETNDFNDYKQVSYYRVKLILQSGATIFSNIAEVENDESQIMKVYPNPARNNISIDTRGVQQNITSISIIDPNGKAVSLETRKPIQNPSLDISKLANGSYWIRLQLANETVEFVKFIKQ